ncbi:MAG: addiction module protein [Verrucomicrobia bacterium]|nr:addiction module protein [Verrucomicrobiota bacterium]
MTRTLLEVTRDAAALPELDRLKLARILLDLSESSAIPSEDAEAAWDDEIARRLRELRTGEVQGVPLANVKRRIEAGFAS